MSKQISRLERAGSGDFYTIDDRQYVRVSRVLDAVVGGEPLMMWYAKLACMRTLSPLIHCGLVPTDEDVELFEFTENEAIREWDEIDAIAAAANWRSNMREAQRYRDERAAIGSLAHALKEQLAAGKNITNPKDWLAGHALRQVEQDEGLMVRLENLGKTKEDLAVDWAHHALRHVESVTKYVELLQPEYGAVRLETIVVHEEYEYAGTADGLEVTYRRSNWEKAEKALKLPPWPFPDKDEFLGVEDLKTGNSVSDTVVEQMAAYANATHAALEDIMELVPISSVDAGVVVHSQPFSAPNILVYERSKLDSAFEHSFLPLLSRFHWSQDRPKHLKRMKTSKPRPTKRGERQPDF